MGVDQDMVLWNIENLKHRVSALEGVAVVKPSVRRWESPGKEGGYPIKDENSIKVAALESSYKHWCENYEKASTGNLGFSIQGESCACCQQYKEHRKDPCCGGCPLMEGGGSILAWCCGGRWGRVYAEYFPESGIIYFPALQEACKAVRDYIKEKLDEAKGVTQFGVGDIVSVSSNNDKRYYKVEVIVGESLEVISKEGYQFPAVEKRFELIFPTSRIPKELDGIRCEPRGDIVEYANIGGGGTGTYGMVLSITGKTFTFLDYEDITNGFTTDTGTIDAIKRVVWHYSQEKL